MSPNKNLRRRGAEGSGTEKIKALKDAQKEWHHDESKNPVDITVEHIAEVVAMMTGIPVQKSGAIGDTEIAENGHRIASLYCWSGSSH